MKGNILITGGLGLLGKPLVDYLISKNYKTFILDKAKNKNRNKLISKKYNFIYGNYQNRKFLKNIIKSKKIKIIFHKGGITQVTEALKNPYETYMNNIMGTVNILEAIRETDKSIFLIYSSSDKAYGEAKNRNYLETDNLTSIYPYDLSKTCSDLICQSYSKVYKLNIAIVRCVNIFGPRDYNLNRLIPETIISLINNKRIKIRSSGKLIRDFLYVDDAVKAYYLIMRAFQKFKKRKLFIYNVGSKYSISVIKVVKIIILLMKKKNLRPIITNKSRQEVIFQKLNYSKIQKELGWKQNISLKEGLLKTIDWYKKNDYLFKI